MSPLYAQVLLVVYSMAVSRIVATSGVNDTLVQAEKNTGKDAFCWTEQSMSKVRGWTAIGTSENTTRVSCSELDVSKDAERTGIFQVRYGEETKKQKPYASFEVQQQSHPVNVYTNGILRFDNVSLNIGSGYHASSGIFEVPVTGTYLFWANIRFVKPGLLYIHLIKEGKRIANGFSNGGPNMNAGDTANLVYVTMTNKGEKLWFEKTGNTDIINGYAYSSYGGALLHAN